MFKIKGTTIHLTRGDIAPIGVDATFEDENGAEVPYTFQPGDVVRLRIMKRNNVSQIELQKDVVVKEETQIVDIVLGSDETRLGDLINKPVEYWYEVELNPDTNPQTIIGYDESGAKILNLYPEGGNKDE